MARHGIQDRSFAFACEIVALHREISREAGTVRALAGQLLRSGTSIGANLEEAHAAHGRADFVAKCSIALKEARETKYWLRLLSATRLVSSDRVSELIDESSEIVAILTTIRRKSRESTDGGNDK